MTTQTDRYYAEGYESGSMDLHKWILRAEKAEARIAALEAALAFWMPDEGMVDPLFQATWDKHIELLPPAPDRIGAALDRGLTAETHPECTEDCVRLGDQHPDCPKHGRDAALIRFAAACATSKTNVNLCKHKGCKLSAGYGGEYCDEHL